MAEPQNGPQQVGRGWMISGELRVQDNTVFEGQINGTLRADGEVELSENAKVSGVIVGQTIRVAGQVEADLVGRQEVELLAGCKVRGRVFASRLVINEGAGFRGEIWVDDQAMQAAQQEVLQQLEGHTPAPRGGGPEISEQELAMLRSKGREAARGMRVHGPPGNGR